MLRAKVETGVTRSSSRSISSAPRIVSAPHTSGNRAATTLRKTQRVSRKRSGNASVSACVRSCWIWSLTWRVARAVPPTTAHGGRRAWTRGAAALHPPPRGAARADPAASAPSPALAAGRRGSPRPPREVGARVRGDERLVAGRRPDRPAHDAKSGLRPDRRLDVPQPFGRRAAYEHEYLRRRRKARRALDPAVDGGALARGRDEVVRAAPEEPRRLEAECRGDDRERERAGKHAPRRADDEVGEALEHRDPG